MNEPKKQSFKIKTSMSRSMDGKLSLNADYDGFLVTVLVDEKNVWAYPEKLPQVLRLLAGQVNRTFNDVYMHDDLVSAVVESGESK